MTDEQIQKWADEAEAGYDVEEPGAAAGDVPGAGPSQRR